MRTQPRTKADDPRWQYHYPWSVWWAKKRVLLKRGKDYFTRTDVFVGLLRNRLRRDGVVATVTPLDDLSGVKVVVTGKRPKGK